MSNITPKSVAWGSKCCRHLSRVLTVCRLTTHKKHTETPASIILYIHLPIAEVNIIISLNSKWTKINIFSFLFQSYCKTKAVDYVSYCNCWLMSRHVNVGNLNLSCSENTETLKTLRTIFPTSWPTLNVHAASWDDA
jgi:hypothetical protein